MDKQTEMTHLLLDRNFFFLIMLLGMFLNYIVFSANDFQMPVKTEYHFNDGFHFNYQEHSEVKLWILSDIFNFRNRLVFSPGDVMIILGMLLLLSNQFKVFRKEKDVN